jgi:peptidyl-prolyl cis-trans isomerase-like 2
MLARQGKYDNCLFHRLVPGFMIQTGDPTGTGAGGESYWGTPFRDEYDLKGAAKHDGRGVIAMANKGAGTNGFVITHADGLTPGAHECYSSSQWYVTFKETPHLDRKHTVFGKLVGGEDVLDALEKLPRKAGTERPAKPVKITEVIMCVAVVITSRGSYLHPCSYQDPFEEYKTRLAKKLAKRAEAQNGAKATPEKKQGDDINWFGIKVGSDVTPVVSAGGGVGKYLNLKRPQEAVVNQPVDGEENSKKKRKIGFGNFDGW